MNEINISTQDNKIPVYDGKIADFCNKVLKVLEIDNWEVSVLFCNDDFIRDLNKKYRNIDSPTDILSFGQGKIINNSEMYVAGDIIISLNTLSLNAGKYNVSREEELKRLLIHGLLHLNGMEHSEKDRKMIELQETILEGLIKESIL